MDNQNNHPSITELSLIGFLGLLATTIAVTFLGVIVYVALSISGATNTQPTHHQCLPDTVLQSDGTCTLQE